MNVRISRSILNSIKTLHKSHVCSCNIVNNENLFSKRFISYGRQSYSNKNISESENLENKDDEHNLTTGLSSKYKVFRDEEAPVIFDVTEEARKIELGELEVEEHPDPYEGINLERGADGVYEIEDLVELLQRDNARQIFVASVPKEYAYVDYIVVVTGRSPRHMKALATFVRKVYKLKRHKRDKMPKIEGENSTDWMALDLGNIALHIFAYEARLKYDLETLWAVGSQYDDLTNVKEEESDIMDKYKDFLKHLQPAE